MGSYASWLLRLLAPPLVVAEPAGCEAVPSPELRGDHLGGGSLLRLPEARASPPPPLPGDREQVEQGQEGRAQLELRPAHVVPGLEGHLLEGALGEAGCLPGAGQQPVEELDVEGPRRPEGR